MPLTLETLLPLWAKAEPGRCRGPEPGKKLPWIQVWWEEEWWDFSPQPDPIDLALLEYAVREAIAVRGWIWEIGRAVDLSSYWSYVDRRDNTSLDFCNSPTPAIALLAAYLQSLGIEIETGGGSES